MAGKTRPSLRRKVLYNVEHSNLSATDKECIKAVFEKFDDAKCRAWLKINADTEKGRRLNNGKVYRMYSQGIMLHD